jgi:hypothetical protein
MTMHSDHHEQNFMYTAAGQTLLLVAGVVVLIALAWLYVF